MDLKSTITLNDGVQIPGLGLGTFRSSPGRETIEAVEYALDLGYRHIDTAAMYGNEEEVGKAVRNSNIARKDVFVTTKVWNDDHGYDETLKAFDESYRKLDIDYVDLYLIHWPLPGKRIETWKALEKLKEEGLVRSIGISNYTIKHTEEVLNESGVKPSVNQFELHPYLYQKELIDYLWKNDIHVEAYCPLTRARKLDDPKLAAIAEKYNKTSAQILIKWSLQRGFVVIPKSVHKSRIKENADVFDFEISDEDMTKIDNFHEDYRVTWDPSKVD